MLDVIFTIGEGIAMGLLAYAGGTGISALLRSFDIVCDAV